ncbi:MAG: COG1361 S-layer family protein, partial [Anaerolineales bacterium]
VYSLTVINPDSSAATLPNALTITGPTATPVPTNTPAATPFTRPLIVVQSYGASSPQVGSFQDYDFEMTLVNAGQATAANIVATFTEGDFTPRATGGVRAVGTLNPGEAGRFFQPLTSGNLSGKIIASLEVMVSYTDPNGTAYTDNFTLTFDVFRPPPGVAAPTPTGTPRPILRPQLVVTGYRTDVSPLQPGVRFTLEMDIQNVGSANAKRVTMIVGGGSASGDGGTGTDGTPGSPGPGGVSGSGGDFTNFAPVNASNVQFLGDLSSGAALTIQQALIVNASTKPAAYPMKLSFVYADEKGGSFSDDQAITLLVYQLPQVDISFYRDPGPLFTGQPNQLPLQIVNLGKSTATLGNMRVTAPQSGAQFSNNTVLIGNLDIGFPFTLDAIVTPDQPGPLDLLVTVDYTDDFNQQQQITQTLTVEVLEGGPVVGPGEEPGGPGGEGPVEPPPAPETFWQRVLRFLRGLFGLDSGQPEPVVPGPDGIPQPGEEPPVGVPPPQG